MRFNAIDWIAWALIVVGAINWGFIGFFQIDLVRDLFGTMTSFSRLVYALVGLGGLWQLLSVLSRPTARH